MLNIHGLPIDVGNSRIHFRGQLLEIFRSEHLLIDDPSKVFTFVTSSVTRSIQSVINRMPHFFKERFSNHLLIETEVDPVTIHIDFLRTIFTDRRVGCEITSQFCGATQFNGNI